MDDLYPGTKLIAETNKQGLQSTEFSKRKEKEWRFIVCQSDVQEN